MSKVKVIESANSKELEQAIDNFIGQSVEKVISQELEYADAKYIYILIYEPKTELMLDDD
jgi:hypothetical protein